MEDPIKTQEEILISNYILYIITMYHLQWYIEFIFCCE